MLSFEQQHRVVTAATLLLGLGCIALSGEFPAWALALSAGLTLFGVLWKPGVKYSKIESFATFCALMIAAVIAPLALTSGNFLYYTILYAILLAGCRSLTLVKAGDFLQIYALSFLHVIAGAVVNPGISFGLILLPYVVFLTLALLLTNLRYGLEAGVESGDKGWRSEQLEQWLERRDLVPGGFVAVTAGLTCLIFFFSVIFFFIFPRIGLGFFAVQTRPGVSVSGFSDTVTLGDLGELIDDPEVVARVRFFDGVPALPVRLRGQSLDHYDGKMWSKTTKNLWELRVDQMGRHMIDPYRPDIGSARAAEIYLEPLGGSRRVMFSPPKPVAFRKPPDYLEALRPHKWRFGRDVAGDVFVSGPPDTSIQYTAYWVDELHENGALRAPSKEIPDWVSRLYLQLPEVDPRVLALAREVTRGAKDQYEAVKAIETFLQRNYRYSLKSRHGGDPLVDFLLNNKEGHCEYFASAMAVMLRLLGIPARLVTGFYGGEVNEYGGYVALRKEDAHAWVEVYFPGHGFVTFDPTPPVALEMRSGRSWWGKLRAAFDAAKLWWYLWVVEYNLDKQVEIIATVLRPGMGSGRRWTLAEFREFKEKVKDAPWATYAGIAVAVVVAAFLARRALRLTRARGKKYTTRAGEPAVQAWLELRKVVKRIGLERGRSETQLEFARRIGQTVPAARGAAERLAWAYVRTVFRGEAVEDREEFEGLLEAVKEAVRAERSSESGGGNGGLP